MTDILRTRISIARTALCFLLLVLAGTSAACGTPAREEEAPLQAGDLSSFFEGYQGCFVLLDVGRDQYVRHDPARCAVRLSPCSTYKIPHALIALETGVIPDQHHVIEWDGTTYPVEAWNRDHTMASAVQDSVVWYFQAVATEIGDDRMQQYLHDLGYGNEDISGGLTQFWLGSSLEISADEQVDFLRRLHAGDLPVSSRSMDIVMEVLVLEEADAYVYRGKTGSCTMDGRQLGWFVGYVSHDDTTYVFATNIEASEASGWQARGITEDILRHLDLLRK